MATGKRPVNQCREFAILRASASSIDLQSWTFAKPDKMTNPGTESRTMLVLRWGLGLLLLWAAISKIANLTAFLGSLYAYALPLPNDSLKVIAIILPWVELLCGLLLIANLWPETTLVVVGLLFGVFLLATGQAWARGLKISCGCFDLSIFGVDKDHSKLVKFIESPGFAFVRNLGLTGAVLFLAKHRGPHSDIPTKDSAGWRKAQSAQIPGGTQAKARPRAKTHGKT